MLPQLDKIKGIALDFIFPRYCVGCSREGEFLCSKCLKSTDRIQPPICPVCGRPQPSGALCPDCISWSCGIDGIRSPFRFEGVLREAVHQLKYRNLRAISETLAEYLFEYLMNFPLNVDTIVPVPLHMKRLRERGYNQSDLLAGDLSKLIGLTLVEDCLVRRNNTVPQARTKNVKERRENISGAFICRNRNVSGKKVLLIDDVSTSGTTLDACAVALKGAGAISVWGLTVAREI